MLERLRTLLRDAGHDGAVIDAVLAQSPRASTWCRPRSPRWRRVPARCPKPLALAAANKRIGNILKKAEASCPSRRRAAQEDAEKALFERVRLIAPLVTSHVANEDYADALKALASVRAEVDRFFDDVMVNVPSRCCAPTASAC
jgi:glycyl-tRNA synthetase beta chain